MIRVFIGYDERETVAYHVLAQSILEKSSIPVSFTPVGNKTLPLPMWWRPKGPYDTTDFSNARFAVPFLCDYDGWALFLDADMLVMRDIAELWRERDERYAVQVVKHEYTPKEGDKAMGHQTRYNCKNWSSVMLMNCKRCKALTPEYLGSANGLDLHQFKWLNKLEVGSLDKRWNHLVGEYENIKNPYNIHYTLGGPYNKGYEKGDYSAPWVAAFERAIYAE